MGHEYVGVDPSPEMYGLMADRLRANPKAHFVKGCAEEIPLGTAGVEPD
jgi:ubiquinone/menaquinone biosynthesis C-methylase UbiE